MMRAVLLALALIATPAYAADFPTPTHVPPGTRCITERATFYRMVRSFQDYGGYAIRAHGDDAQRFSDFWRETTSLKPQTVSVVYVWIIPKMLVAKVAEIGSSGCLMTTTTLSIKAWAAIVSRKPMLTGEPA